MSLKPGLPGLVAVLSVAMLAVVGVVLWPRGGDAVRGPGPVALESMPSTPSEQWRWTAEELFGEEFVGGRLTVLLEESGVSVVQGMSAGLGIETAMIGVDAETGEPLWDEPRRGESFTCVVGADGRLGCVRNVRHDGAVVSRLDILDLESGDEVAHRIVASPGSPSILPVDDGYVVMTNGNRIDELLSEMTPTGPGELRLRFRVVPGREDVEVPDLQGMMSAYSLTGRQLWTTRPPLNHTALAAGSYGDLVAVTDFKYGGFSVYRTDTGKRVHLRKQLGRAFGSPGFVVYPGGFAVGRGFAARAANVEFFDRDGVRDGSLHSWRLLGDFRSPTDVASADRIPVVLRWTHGAGMASATEQRVQWSVRQDIDQVRVLDSGHLAVASTMSEDGVEVTTWRVLDADTGEQSGDVRLEFGYTLFGFDGDRLLFLGEAGYDHAPNVPRLSAWDPTSGRLVWELEPTDPEARWEQVDNGLYLTGLRQFFVARYA